MNVAEWNGLDWILAIVLLVSVVRALMRGFLRAIFGMVGVIAGFILASAYYIRFGLVLGRWISLPSTASVAAYLILVIVTVIVFGLVGRTLQRTASAVGLGFLDRIAGGLFGFVRGCLFGVGLLLAVSVTAPGTNFVTESRLGPYFLVVAREVSFVVPKDLQLQIGNGAYDLQQNGGRWVKRP